MNDSTAERLSELCSIWHRCEFEFPSA